MWNKVSCLRKQRVQTDTSAEPATFRFCPDRKVSCNRQQRRHLNIAQDAHCLILVYMKSLE